MNWEELSGYCNNCNRCGLSQTRHNVVLGKGNVCAPILFVGEGPGAKEDEQGLPFVGQAGQLLDLALESLGFTADDYYITNVVKCRPPENRTPLSEEIDACMPLHKLHQDNRLVPKHMLHFHFLLVLTY